MTKTDTVIHVAEKPVSRGHPPPHPPGAGSQRIRNFLRPYLHPHGLA